MFVKGSSLHLIVIAREEKALEARQFDSPFLVIVLYLYRCWSVHNDSSYRKNEIEGRNNGIGVGALPIFDT